MHTLTTWYIAINRPWEDIFYPSLVKRIKKSEKDFNNIFLYKQEKTTKDFFSNTFFPLYEKVIGQRKDYILNTKAKYEQIIQRLEKGYNYHHLSVFEKTTNRFIGGTLYVKDKELAKISLRVFDREINKKYKFETTLDFWAEYLLIKSFQNEGYQKMNHGTDHHRPEINRIGLQLFKLKLGGKPKVSTRKHDILIKTPDDMAEKTPVFFFTEPDNEGFFRKSVLINKKDDENNSTIHELKKVLSWSNIELLEINL